jgi:hypothetical protein
MTRLHGLRPALAAAAMALLLAAVAPAAGAAVTIDPASHDFGRVVIGQQSGLQFVLTNDTGATLQDLTLTHETTSAPAGAAGAAFALDAPLPDTHCTNVSVGPGLTCTIELEFLPDAPGPYEGELKVFAEGTQVGPTVALAGTGLAALELPSVLGFGGQAPGTIGAPRAITMTVNAPQTLGVAKVTGAHAADFLIAADDCSGVAFAGVTTCELRLRFAPSAGGARSASLVVGSALGQATTALGGTGVPPAQAPPPPPPPQVVPGDSEPATLRTRRTRLDGDAVALRVRCPAGATASTGTITLRTAGRVRDARRKLGSAAFACRAGRSDTVQVVVRSRVRRVLRRHRRGVRLVATLFTSGAGAVSETNGTLRLRRVR